MNTEEFNKAREEITDEQLINKTQETLHKLCETGGRSFIMTVPPRIDDTDMLFGELINRYKKAIQVQARVMPNEVVAGDIKLMFGEDTEKYSLWCEIVNDVFMEYDTTSEGEDAQILIDKIERLLKLVSQREA